MSEYQGSYSPDADQTPAPVTWQDQSCQVCGSVDVIWSYSLTPDAGAPSIALPRRCYLCAECQVLLSDGDLTALAERHSETEGDWPEPLDVVRALHEALDGQPVHR
ncbi:hypothetical protein ACIBUY_04715 [Streptomyces sp. NPDC050085]|uniref:hypothetical protein n=1 Tax=Streptomyces sp. NPDC050085 TaxID=3365600 RepID=UPI00379073F9